MADVLALFQEYAEAYARGDRPEARAYLDRAGADADELARLLDAFLQAAPVADPDPDTIALVSAWMEEEPPLVHLRASKGIRVDAVVAAIVGDAALTEEQAPKVKSYYQRLEQGLLDPRGVSGRVWETLRRLIGPAAEAAAVWRISPEPLAYSALYRGPAEPAFDAADDAMDAIPPMPERDAVDELFTAAP